MRRRYHYGEIAAASPTHLHGQTLKSLKVYDDPFGENEVCIELSFVDGQVACLGIGPRRPTIVSTSLCHEIDHGSDPTLSCAANQEEFDEPCNGRAT